MKHIIIIALSLLNMPINMQKENLDNECRKFVEDEIIITLKNEYSFIDNFEDLSFLNKIEYDYIEDLSTTSTDYNNTKFKKIFLVNLKNNSVYESIDKIKYSKEIDSLSPNYITILPKSTVPNDTNYSEQWALDKIDIERAWDITTGSSVLVGIIDSGIDSNHDDLKYNLVTSLGQSYCDAFSYPYIDSHGHGTHVAGIIGASGNNNLGVSGVCWDISMISLKVFINDEYAVKSSSVAKAIDYANSLNIKLLNISIGGETYDSTLYAALNNYNGLAICAAGNENYNTDITHVYPGSFNFDNIICVGNSTINDTKNPASNYGATSVDLFAPGTDICSTTPNGEYKSYSGSSMATPFVTGVAALLLSKYPTMDAKSLKKTILDNVDVIPALSGLCVTGGRLNAYKALSNPHLHTYNYSYENCNQEEYHNAYCSCGDMIQQSHTWTSVNINPKITNNVSPNYIPAYKCRFCQYISYIGPNL